MSMRMMNCFWYFFFILEKHFFVMQLIALHNSICYILYKHNIVIRGSRDWQEIHLKADETVRLKSRISHKWLLNITTKNN